MLSTGLSIKKGMEQFDFYVKAVDEAECKNVLVATMHKKTQRIHLTQKGIVYVKKEPKLLYSIQLLAESVLQFEGCDTIAVSMDEQKMDDEPMDVLVDALISLHPGFKTELKALLKAYQYPLKRFCQKEAAYRLDSLAISEKVDDYESMVELIGDNLFNSDTFINGEAAEWITMEVLEKDFILDIRKKEDVEYLKARFFTSNFLLTLSGEHSDIPYLAEIVCELNTKEKNNNMVEAFKNELQNYETEKGYVTTNELQELYLDFLKKYKLDTKTRIKISGGYIVAEENPNPEYPGICVYFETDNGNIMDLARMENHNKDGKSTIKVYNYEDVWSEDWTKRHTIDVEEARKAICDSEGEYCFE